MTKASSSVSLEPLELKNIALGPIIVIDTIVLQDLEDIKLFGPDSKIFGKALTNSL